jgi:hypothetical protein
MRPDSTDKISLTGDRDASLEKASYTTQEACIDELPEWHPGGKIGEV